MGKQDAGIRLSNHLYKGEHKGNKSVVVDALPRKHEDVDALLCVISIIQLDIKALIFWTL